MKKIILLSLILALVASIAVACAPKSNPGDSDGKATAEPAPATEAAPTAAPATEVPVTEAPTEAPTETPAPAPEYEIPYVTEGLVALFEGYYNTRRGQDMNTEVWEDLSGNKYDIDFSLDETASWAGNGLEISSARIHLPEELLELINGEEFTVEYSINDLVVTDTNFATLLNVRWN